jgi:hypothetical protein
MASKLSRSDAANIIDRFLAGQGDAYEWDDFTSVRHYHDAEVRDAARRCCEVRDLYPPPAGTRAYCNAEGVEVLRAISLKLRQGQSA